MTKITFPHDQKSRARHAQMGMHLWGWMKVNHHFLVSRKWVAVGSNNVGEVLPFSPSIQIAKPDH
jgi:hypothetical protein